jgi:hypothetical protein
MKRLLVFSLLISLAFPAAAQTTENSTNTTDLIAPDREPDNDTIEAGRVMDVNLSAANAISDSWAGVYGNVTASYVVGSGDSPFFSWGLLDASYIYASPQTLDFSSDWSPTNISYMESEYPFLGNGTERPEDTFDTTGNVSSDFQDSPVNDTLAAETFDEEGDPYWKTYFVNDGDGGFFAGEVVDGRSFNDREADYQLILPEDGTDDQDGTAFGVYLELE